MEETLEILQDNLGQALIDTAYMVVVSAIIGVVLGTLVALLLYLTENRLFTPNHALNVIVGFIVNAIRSLPFLILMVVLIPVAQSPCRSPQCRSSRESRKARSPKLIRACLRLPSPLVLPHAKSLWMRCFRKLCRRLFAAWCSPSFR